MKDATSIAIVFVICLVMLLLYFFIGQRALNTNNAAKAAELAQLEEEERTINWMGSQISEFEERLPDLKRRINYYKTAIPTNIEDHIFFTHLARELNRSNVELLKIQQSGNRVWLGQISKTDEEKYLEAGLDINAIKQIRTSNFKIRLYGDFEEVLTVFENLKILGRLYTVDQVISPAGGGSGTVLVDNSGDASQMEITGSLFYGIPQNYRDAEGLDKKYMEVAVIRNARDISTMVKAAGYEVLTGEELPQAVVTPVNPCAETEEEEDPSVQSAVPAGMNSKEGRG